MKFPGKIILGGGTSTILDGSVVDSVSSRLEIGSCTLCGSESFIENMEVSNCPSCTRRTRQRSLPIIAELVNSLIEKNSDGELLAFAFTGIEREHIAKDFETVCSVSLYGDYGKGHMTGVDVRDLSRFGEGRFGAVFSSLLFDYFIEHEEGLREIYRVLRVGGFFLTHIASQRVLEGYSPPNLHKMIGAKPGSFEYLEGAEIPSIKVGKSWLLGAMERCGFSSCSIDIHDPGNGEVVTWFLGKKEGGV